jgi:hypothetical protein
MQQFTQSDERACLLAPCKPTKEEEKRLIARTNVSCVDNLSVKDI